MKAGILLGGALFLAACAAPTEKQIEALEYREAEKKAELLDFRQYCRNRGGVLVFHASGGRTKRNAPPDNADYLRCQRGGALY
ncbi:MAG: hypothetical protein L0Y45_00430 [Woeseiaceae bacterium]|nr:hypothetical protein [Woeseiaceae bacterium]